jgi:hypothetical protein
MIPAFRADGDHDRLRFFFGQRFLDRTDNIAVETAAQPLIAGDDDVALLPAGEAVRLTVNGKTLYVLGSTTLEVHAQNYSDSPFAWNEAGEGGGADVSVISLSVNENGTYTAPSGTAYSPVIVNVQGGADIGIVDETAYVGEATIQE